MHVVAVQKMYKIIIVISDQMMVILLKNRCYQVLVSQVQRIKLNAGKLYCLRGFFLLCQAVQDRYRNGLPDLCLLN
jgi:hypothetical protein